MKEYPKIPRYDDFLGQECIAFYKHDGSNLRVELSRKRSWYKWGTRHRLFDKSDPEYSVAMEVFEKKYAEPLEKIIRDNYPKFEGAMAFLEFLGPNSFAGQHVADDPKDLILFDVNITKKGFVSPDNFVKLFGSLHIPEVLYRGPLTEAFVKKVREKQLPVDEGVVCKGGEGHGRWACKIKTWDYLKKIQAHFGTSWGEFWE